MKREIVVFSLETLSENKTDKNGCILMDGLVSLLWRFKPNTVLNCCVVIKGNAFPALVPALTSDTDEEGAIFE